MKILICGDIKGWAIDQLIQAKMKYNPHHIWKCEYVHPRDAGSKGAQDLFKKTVDEFNPDIIHFEYFRTCAQLMEAIPELKERKVILTHHNQRDKALRHSDWIKLGVDHLVTHTEKCRQLLIEKYNQPKDKVTVIPHGIDLDYFKYVGKDPKTEAIGYAGRIVPWKGLKGVAEAGAELGYPVLFMGRQEKADYFNTISEEGKKAIDWGFMNCKDDERLQYYANLTCYVGNSIDGYEEGTLEYLEAMACGVPVITTPNGVAKDIGKDRVNCLMVPFDDKQALTDAIYEVMHNKELRDTLRKNGWETVKNMTHSRMARRYDALYNKINNGEELMSVIIPTTYDRIEQVETILDSLNKNDKGVEAIIVYDEEVEFMDKFMMESRRLRDMFPDINVKVEHTMTEGYNLAMARNLGAISSIGDILVFCDSRLLPDETALTLFRTAFNNLPVKEYVWLFGNKGANKKTFVENFSAIRRDNFFKFGMFNERITKYGGMSQEIRTRFIKQGGKFEYIQDARASEMIKSSIKTKRQDIIEMKDLLYRMFEGNNH